MNDRQYFKKIKLGNGIRLWTHAMDVPFAQIYFIFPVGAVHSIKENAGGGLGVAHVLEHMLFEQKSDAESDGSSLGAKIIQSGGEWNAWTRSFTTEVSVSLPSADFSQQLPVLFKYLFRPKFDDKKIPSEISIIAQENIQKKYFPGETEFEQYQFVRLMPSMAASREQFFGTKESLVSISNEQLHAFHTSYSSDQLQILVGGNFDGNQLFSLCSEIETSKIALESQKNPLNAHLKNDGTDVFTELDSPVYVWGGVTADCNASTLGAIRFIVNYLTDGQNGYLNEWLREENAWSYGVDSAVWYEQDRIAWKITMPVLNDEIAQQVQAELHSRVKKALIDTESLIQYAERAIKSELFSFQSLDERMESAAEEISVFGCVTTEEEYRNNVLELSQGGKLLDTYERYFSPKVSSSSLAVPDK